ncbi:MAG: hypothetical protein LBV51_01780 [Acholeplasmatales bacterium]|jgi:PDZ domain-containing protein|nr:hypothetical protein [Acholeplasmatales bacterium]
MKKFLTQHKKLILIFLFAYLYLFFILVFPTSFDGLTPDSLNKISSNIVIEDNSYKDNDNSFFSISVLSSSRITPLQKMILDLKKDSTTNKRNDYVEDISSSDNLKMNQLSKEISFYNSTYNALYYASLVSSDITVSREFLGVRIYYRDSRFSNKLNVGSLVTQISAGEISYDASLISSSSDIKSFISLFREYKFNIVCDNKNIEIEYKKGDHYFQVEPYFNITSNIKFSYPGLKSNVGGPSGGLLQTLYLYSSLLKQDFSKYKISGTGTISWDGSVGAIGGIEQKMYAASYAGATHFFMPNSNYSTSLDKIPHNYAVYKVSNFSEALGYLDGINI